MNFRPISATLLAVCGVILVAVGLFFVFLRPPFLPEDARYAGGTLAQLQAVAPGVALWLARVFWVLGGFVVSTGILTIHLARTSFRSRASGAAPVALLAGISSIGVMATVNFLIDSAFKWALLSFALLWGLALVLFWRGK